MTTIDTVARAMFDADSKENGLIRDWQFEGGCHATYRAMARAALQAIRVPDAGVTEAGESAAWDKGNSMPTIRAMPIGFTAMIDAILSEQPEP